MNMTVKRKFHVRKQKKGRKELRSGEAKPEMPVGRVPRISRLMALAIKFDEMIRSGEVKDQAELARLGHVSRARLSQIMNLLNLAPDIQEAILFLPPTVEGRDVGWGAGCADDRFASELGKATAEVACD